MTDAGMATPAMIVARQLRMNAKHHEARQDAAENQVDVDLVQRGVDVARLVADDLERHVGRQLRPARRSRLRLTASITATVFAPDWRRISSVTVGTPLSRATERCSFVPSSAQPMSRTRIGHAVARGDDEIVEGARVDDAAHRAQRLLARGRR